MNKQHLKNLQEYHFLRLLCFGNRPAADRKETREQMFILEGEMNEYKHQVGISQGNGGVQVSTGLLDEVRSGGDSGGQGDNMV